MKPLEEISARTPFRCIVESQNKIIVYGIDVPCILSQIVGTISVHGLNIEKAISKTYVAQDGELACFVDEFIVNTNRAALENWEEHLPAMLESQCNLVHQRKGVEASKKIIEFIAEDIARKNKEAHAPPVVDIQTQEQAHSNQLAIIVQGEDAPYLLYVLSSAIETQGFSIASFSIDTEKGFVSDTFNVTKKPDTDTKNLVTLRFHLMLQTQVRFLLKEAPDPYSALLRFQEVVNRMVIGKESNTLEYLLSSSDKLRNIMELLGSSDFLWEQVVRAQSHEFSKIFSVMENNEKSVGRNPVHYKTDIAKILKACTSYEEKIGALNKFKDQEAYLIDINNLVHHKNDVRRLSGRLSALARAVVSAAAELVEEKMKAAYGIPRTAAEQKSDWALLGLGKFGGEALGYASDIEIIFIYEDAGNTDGKQQTSNAEYFERFVRELVRIIKARKDGIFTVDTRLRPHGDAGPLAVRLRSFLEYYQSEKAHSVEKLALTRMRPITGNPRLAERILRIKRNILYLPHAIERRQIFSLRKAQLETKVIPGTRNAKFGQGALVDVEYGVQMLQVEYGKDNVSLQLPGIHNALITLYKLGVHSKKQSGLLVDAYMFFRKLINALRMRRGSAQDVTLPAEHTWELEHLARRMDYVSKELSAGEQLLLDFDTISAQVYDFINSHFDKPYIEIMNKELSNPGALVFIDNVTQAQKLLRIFDNPEKALQHIKSCARTGETQVLFSRILLLGWVRIFRSGDPDLVVLLLDRLIETFTDKKLKKFYAQLLDQPKSFTVLVDMCVTSRFLSEEIIKNPEYISYLIGENSIYKKKDEQEFSDSYKNFEHAHHATTKHKKQNLITTRKNVMRMFRKKEIMRIIVRDVCLQKPLHAIYREISFVAKTIIQQALNYAAEEINATTQGITIFAFGKLGVQELNYSSDLDLMCVYNDDCTISFEKVLALFQKTVKYLTDFTNTGVAYRVDLRLRPYGESGPIVDHIDKVIHYYSSVARLWELQAALKLSAVAGDMKLTEGFYNKLHIAIATALPKHKKEQILENIHALRTQSVRTHLKNLNELYEIKNSWGGIRDIEFGTQALQLLHYGTALSRLDTLHALRYFYDNDIITKSEYEENRNNYIFLRKVEHFLQVFEDKQLYAIPDKSPLVMRRLSWLLLQDQDEDVFLKKLKTVKTQVHAWYTRTIHH